MKTEFTTAHYVAAFKKIQIAHHYLRMLQANYHAPGRTITATQMAKTMGYSRFSAANLHYGKLGRLIGKRKH